MRSLHINIMLKHFRITSAIGAGNPKKKIKLLVREQKIKSHHAVSVRVQCIL